MRLLLSPKWMAWHVFTLGAMIACGWLAVWQWQRAGSAMGSALNVGYGLQWPVFAVFFGFMWWRFLRMEIERLHDPEADETAPDPVPADDSAAATTPAPRVPADSATRDGAAADDGSTAERAATVEDAAAEADVPARPSPFTSRPAGAAPPRSTDPQLRAYNEELARLAARQEETTP